LAGALLEYITWSSSLGDFIVTESKIIESRLIAEKVARRLNLVKENATSEEFNKVVSEIQNSVSTEREKETSLIHIIVLSSDPKMAEKAMDCYNSGKELENRKIYGGNWPKGMWSWWRERMFLGARK